ncbi:hypothetical protein BJV82DRAFT_414970 [Fennellomyces sp. T-0311]|nr:hypothetical protein BJV82DRAFT_414970 [Fennellomyces sp. T-0311]
MSWLLMVASDLICKCDNSSNELRNLSEWFISAAWNLGLQCCERAMEYRGRQFLLTACKLMKKVTGDTQAMDKRQKISLFMCIAAKQLSGNSEMSDHQEILSVSQTLAQDQEYDPSICELLQIFQVVSFVALNKYPQAINAIENCCKAASDPSQLCLCERLVVCGCKPQLYSERCIAGAAVYHISVSTIGAATREEIQSMDSSIGIGGNGGEQGCWTSISSRCFYRSETTCFHDVSRK